MKNIFTILSLLLFATPLLANELLDSTRFNASKDSVFVIHPEVSSSLQLEEEPDVLKEGMISPLNFNDSIQRYIDLARTVFGKIKETKNYITSIDESTRFTLPVGIPKLIDGINYELAIHAIRLKPTHAELDVLMQFEVPQNGQWLIFKANGIKFSKSGGIIGDATLELVGDYAINLSGDKSQIILKGSASNGKTFITIDCDGFKELGLDADIKFSRDIIRPENPDGSQGSGNVITSFSTTLTSWNDLVVQINLPPFQITSMPGMGFTVRDAVFDFSDLRNAPNIKFPENYNPDFSEPQLANLWRGVYLRELSVQLPPEFKSKGTTTRIGFTGYDLLIDNQGFTGTVIGKNLLPLNNGDMNGWAFSVDSLGVEFKQSQLVQAGFNGNIVVSVSDEQTPLDYTAVIGTGGNYLFTVSPANNLAFTIWGGSKVDIYQASYLEVTVENNKFLPKAVLHGKMNIQAKLSEKGQGIELADISFENLQIQSVQPYIKVGNFSFGSEALQQKMAGFPISIKNIGMKNITASDVGLDFDLLLNLTGEKGGAFAADAGLTVIGTLKNESGRQRWRYKDAELRSIMVDINGGAFKIKGSLTFYRNDVAYGDGFNGQVNAEFPANIKVKGTAIFGSLQGERYWYADAMATFTPGILIFPGVAFYGFGGGAYYRMKMDNSGNGSPLGKTASGIVYVPDMNSGLGIKATLVIGSTPTDKAFNADVTFDVSFFRGGGIRYISMTGNAFIATPGLDANVEKLKAKAKVIADKFSELEAIADNNTGGIASMVTGQESMIKSIHGDIGKSAGSKGAISARLFISYDFENRVLHGNFNANIDVGAGIIKGGGDAVLHFAPGEWYVYVGTPDQRFGVSVGIGPLRANADSYFMVGTKIPGSPPPPPEVTKILGGGDYNYMKDLNAIGQGAGFAFGSSFSLNTGDLTFLMFYANFSAGAGFDIMLKNYGDTYCAGDNERIGINGWYANGQVYAYFKGEVGIRVKIFGKKKKVEILSIGAAALLQAKLPNPFWMRGAVGGYFSVLGGLVKGNCKFEVTLGKECQFIKKESEENVLDNISVIAQLTPGLGETEVNVFNTPQVVFNLPVDKEFKLVDDDVEKTFRIKLDLFKLTLDGKEIQGSTQWNENHDVLAFNSFDVFPSKKLIKTIVQVSFEEFKNGAWVRSLDSGQPITERQEISFTTGPAPDYIPLQYVSYSYPTISQLNFYKAESTEGYIQLSKGIPELFAPSPDWVQVGRFTDTGGEKVQFNIVYNNGRIDYTIPGGSLKNNQIYAFEMVNIPRNKAGAVDRNVSEVNTKVAVGNETLDAEVKTKKATGSIEELQEKSIFNTYFRSSLYSTLDDKLSKLSFSRGWTWALYPGVYELGTTITGPELFEKQEFITSTYDQNKNIRLEAEATSVWYKNLVDPLLYIGYPIHPKATIRLRNQEPLGVPPMRAVYIRQNPSDITLTPEAINANNYTYPSMPAGFIYNLSLEMFRDYLDIQASCANLSVTEWNERVNKLLLTPFPVLSQGDYQIKVKHVLPGINKITSEKTITINYALQFIK